MTAIVAAPGFDEAEVLRLAASVERASEHPLGGRDRRGRGGARASRTRQCRGFDSPTGKGALGTVEGSADRARQRGVPARAGRRRLGACASRPKAARRMARRRSSSASTASVAGIFAIADPVKATTPEALAALKAEGIRVVMLTGDNRTTAKAVARRLGIDDVEAEVLPDQKSAVVAALQGDGPRGRDGRRRRERRAGACRRRCRHRHGHRHRRRHGKRRRDAAQGRSHGHRPGAPAVAGRRCATSARTCSSPSSTTPLGVPVAAGVLYPFFGILLSPIIAAAAMALVVRQRDRQCAASQELQAMTTSDLRRPGMIAVVSLAIVIAFYVLREHWSHALGALPYLLLLACPLLHLFHGHGGHGGHGHQARHRETERERISS